MLSSFYLNKVTIWENVQVDNWIMVLIILTITFLAVLFIRKVIDKFFKLSSTHLNTDPTKYKFLQHFLSGVITIIGIGIAIYIIPSLRALSYSLFASAGILAVIIGFASQAAFSNIISGIFIVIFKPFRVNDRIQIGDLYSGIVEDITLRHTVIRNFENRMIVIPNSKISDETIINSNLIEDKICKFINIGISYDSNIDNAISIIQDEVMKHPDYFDNRTEEQIEKGEHPVIVRVIGFGDSSVNLRAYIWALDPPTAWIMGCDLNKSIKERFDKEGIEIPYPYRTIVYKKDITSNN